MRVLSSCWKDYPHNINIVVESDLVRRSNWENLCREYPAEIFCIRAHIKPDSELKISYNTGLALDFADLECEASDTRFFYHSIDFL